MNPMHEAVTAVLAGEPRRFADIVRFHDERIKRFVSCFVQETSLRDDIVQETFYKAFKSLGSLSCPENLEPWLKAIARRCLVDHLRRRRRVNLHTVGAAQLDVIQPQDRDHDCTWIWGEVETLTPIHREVLYLRYAHSRTWSEIALELGVPESTVRGRLFEARKALKNRLLERGLYP